MDMVFDIGKRLIALRELKGISTNRLSDDAVLSQSFVRDIENGRKIPTVKSLYQICEALGITLKDFFDDGVTGSIKDDILLKEIYRLSPEQREKLAEFLKLI